MAAELSQGTVSQEWHVPNSTPSQTSSSTSPCPTTSTSETPRIRPAGDSLPRVLAAHPRISAAQSHSRTSSYTLATASPPASSFPLLCLVISCTIPPRFLPRKAL